MESIELSEMELNLDQIDRLDRMALNGQREEEEKRVAAVNETFAYLKFFHFHTSPKIAYRAISFCLKLRTTTIESSWSGIIVGGDAE